MPYEIVFVEWDSTGGEASGGPMAFTARRRRWEVAEIIDRWYEGGFQAGRTVVDYFKVRTVEGNVYFLRHASLFDASSIWIEEKAEK